MNNPGQRATEIDPTAKTHRPPPGRLDESCLPDARQSPRHGPEVNERRGGGGLDQEGRVEQVQRRGSSTTNVSGKKACGVFRGHRENHNRRPRFREGSRLGRRADRGAIRASPQRQQALGMGSVISLLRLRLAVSVIRHHLGVSTPDVHAEVRREEEPSADGRHGTDQSQGELKLAHLGA